MRVGQDADPALSCPYEDWGWPATIMLDKDGNEVFKRRGANGACSVPVFTPAEVHRIATRVDDR